MSTITPTRPSVPSTSTKRRVARLISDGLEPKNIIVVVLVTVGVGTSGWVGLGWALWAALFAGFLPTLFIRLGIRRGHWQDRNLSERQQRLRVIPAILASIAVGTAAMLVLDAPGAMVAMVVAMLATLVAIMVVTVAWKISVHTSVLSGAITMTAIALGPWWWLAVPLLPLVAWSRVVLREHTSAQAIAGSVLGFVVAGSTFLGLR